MGKLSSIRVAGHILLPTLLILLITGCSGNVGPTVPVETGFPNPAESVQFEEYGPVNRYQWGMWEVFISANHLSASVIPARSVEMHVNTVGFLEKFPCTNCLQIGNLTPYPENKLSIDVTLIHPFPGLPKLTGFDVRGVFVTEADFIFPASGRWIGWGDDIPRMLLPNGYTQLFNPMEFPFTNPGPAMLKYQVGKFSTGGILESTLNPYIAYKREEPRRMFEPGSSETRTIQLQVPTGPFKFGYIVDACWVLVDGPVTDPVNDFPPDANCLEAYRVDVQAGSNLQPVAGSEQPVEVNVFDHQGLDTISVVTMEAPDLFSGVIQLEYIEDTGVDKHFFTALLPNEYGVPPGDYPLLIRVLDTENDENLGQIDAWFLTTISVGSKKGWAINWGSQSFHPNYSDVAYDVACDDEGNIYVVGRYGAICDFDPGPGVVEKYGIGYEAYLVKYNPEGQFVWVRKWGSDSVDEACQINVQDTGIIYVLSKCNGIVDLNPGVETDIHPSGMYLSCFDTEGNYVWGRSLGGVITNGSYNNLEVDHSGNILVVNSFTVETDFDPGPGTDYHTPNGFWDCCITKLDPDGDFVWARTWGGFGDYYNGLDVCYAVASDSTGRIFVAGRIENEADYDPGPGVDMHDGKYFLSSFTQNGDYIAARVGSVRYEDLETDNNDNLYMLGRTTDEVADLDPGPGVDIHPSNRIFLSLISHSGEYQWGMSWGDGILHVDSLVLGDNGEIYITGSFAWYLTDFAPGPLTDYHGSVGKHDIYISKFLMDGEYQWTRTWGSEVSDSVYGVAVDSSGNAFVAGGFKIPADFDPGPGVEILVPYGNGDAFLSKIPPDGNW